MMYVSKYKSHKIALFNSMKKSNIAPISLLCWEGELTFWTWKTKGKVDWVGYKSKVEEKMDSFAVQNVVREKLVLKRKV